MTYDLQILRGANQSAPTVVAYATPESAAITGPAAAAQRFAILFLSEFSSQPVRGCTFQTLLKNGRIANDAAVILNFALAVVQIMQQMGDQSALPLNEQIVRADLIAHTLFSANLSLTVQLTLAGGTITIPIPIEVV
jgi:hypothetical protein